MSSEPVSLDLDRRSFMKASALAGGLALGGGVTGHALAQESGEETPDGSLGQEGEHVKTICNFCAVGCGFMGERKGDAFVGQEPWMEHPVNNGSLCSKGAGIYGSEHSEKRLKHPMTLDDSGNWQKLSWDDAMSTVTGELDRIRQEEGPDGTMWLGSAHHCNEEAYAFRKLAAFYGTTNVDHQARICHSTTVAGLANTWGYGAMTNTINDYRNFDLDLIIGQNPAEAHPIAMQHILEGQKRGGTIAVVEPRYTKTAAHADYFYRIRPGTDVALMMGLLNYIRGQGELDQEMIRGRVQGWPDVDAQIDDYDLETASDITWMSVEEIQELGDLLIENKPNLQIEWAMGGTQHNNGTQNIRSYALTSLGTGSAARAGGGLQVMRGHSNVQGATDLGPNSHILPGYYSVSSLGSWDYWADVWDQSPWTSGSTSLQDIHSRYDDMSREKFVAQDGAENTFANEQETIRSRSMMLQKGLTVARWFEGALPKEERLHNSTLYQPTQLKAAVFHGHSTNSISEMDRMRKAMNNLDLLVVVDLFPSLASVMIDHEEGPDNVILLPCSSQYEHWGTLTNSHRSVQWRNPVRPPGHNSKTDMEIIQLMAEGLGHGEHFDWGSGPDLYSGRSTYEDTLREINLGVRTIGYQQSPERLQRQYEYDHLFSDEDLRATSGPVEGEFWQLPWPCWGDGHPGTPIIWRDDLDPRRGGQDFRARWGTAAPSPQEWQGMDTSGPYPLQRTFQQQGQQGLNMLRAPYQPDWETNYDGTVRGVPEYPGFTTVWPDDITNPTALSLPYAYALDPTKSVFDTARALKRKQRQGTLKPQGAASDINPAEYRQYDYKQPDAPTGRGKARGVAWDFLDTVPVHREPIESPRPDLVGQWPVNGQQKNFYRLDQNNSKTQQQAMRLLAQNEGFDTIMTTGRQVEHQGGGSESRSVEYLADLQPHMYAEIHPNLAEEIGVDGGELVTVSTTDRGSVLLKARVTHRPNERETFLPFHWGGIFQGESLEEKYPDGSVPYALGDSVNIITSRGYDVETQMQETKPAMVKVQKATQQVVDDLNMNVDLESLEFPQDRNDIGVQKEYDVRDYHTVQ